MSKSIVMEIKKYRGLVDLDPCTVCGDPVIVFWTSGGDYRCVNHEPGNDQYREELRRHSDIRECLDIESELMDGRVVECLVDWCKARIAKIRSQYSF